MNTLETLIQNFQNLGVQVEQARDALDTARRSGYPEETKRCEARVAELESEREAINSAVITISQKGCERREGQERATAHTAKVKECREAREERDRLTKLYAKKLRAWEVSRDKLTNAEAHFSNHLSSSGRTIIQPTWNCKRSRSAAPLSRPHLPRLRRICAKRTQAGRKRR